MQERGSDELHKLKEKAAEEVLKAERTAAGDSDRVTSLYKESPRSAFDIPYPAQPAAPGFARPTASLQACLCPAVFRVPSAQVASAVADASDAH